MSAYDNLINPIDFMMAEEPVAFDLMPGGASDLLPEIKLMVARADSQGRPYRFYYENPNDCLVPESICREVLGRDWVVAEIEKEIATIYGEVTD